MQSDSEPHLSPGEIRDLCRIAGMMIPPNQEYGVPGADDPIIAADIVHSLGRDLNEVRSALVRLAKLAGGAFADLDDTRQKAVAETFLITPDAATTTLGRVILQCYYRDDRVLRALGLEARAPFPKGYTLEQGNWSLLDPVRGRPKLWRDAP